MIQWERHENVEGDLFGTTASGVKLQIAVELLDQLTPKLDPDVVSVRGYLYAFRGGDWQPIGHSEPLSHVSVDDARIPEAKNLAIEALKGHAGWLFEAACA